MKNWKWIVLSGFLVWLLPFAVAVALSPVRANDRTLFESNMPVVISITAVGFVIIRPAAVSSPVRGLALGLAWLAISIGLDLLMFMSGPMKMTFSNYMKDIGLTYFMFPVLTLGLAWRNRRRDSPNPDNT
jgi:hypothetical protein